MTFPFRSFPSVVAAVAAFGCLLPGSRSIAAQASSGTEPQTKFQRFASHFDLGIQATGEFTTDANGVVQNSVSTTNGNLSVHATRTVGALATLRGTKSPWIGGEFNFRYARFSQDFQYPNQTDTTLNFSAQNTANEFTFGYIAHPDHPLLGLQPFVGAGAGTLEFKPTRGSATGYNPQARATYYYTLGGDKLIYGDLLGVRVGFRELFYLAPDFGQNYLRIKTLQTTLEPTIGFYLHF